MIDICPAAGIGLRSCLQVNTTMDGLVMDLVINYRKKHSS